MQKYKIGSFILPKGSVVPLQASADAYMGTSPIIPSYTTNNARSRHEADLSTKQNGLPWKKSVVGSMQFPIVLTLFKIAVRSTQTQPNMDIKIFDILMLSLKFLYVPILFQT